MTDNLTLLDSTVTEIFLDKQVWRELKIGRFKLCKLLTIHNVDGTKNQQGKIEHYCWLKIRHQDKTIWMKFFLTNLGKDRFILGYLFLFVFNLDVDWQRAKLRGGVVGIETTGFQCA
jgi:hypothetical protein